ncbi:MAG: DUF3575 domain-containing protein [Deltaproteobacteria bacterium]|nr:DUF3575 domain-containing protein [Deltaproteobacteria bacterium]
MRLAISALFSATLLGLTGPAWAQVPPATPSTRAPAVLDDEEPRQPIDADISQINGVPVPVGSHNEYHYSFKRWNVSTNPLGWVLGTYGVSVGYGMHQNFAIRGDLNYFRSLETDAEGFELGVALPIYLRRTYQGPFLEPGIIIRDFSYQPGDSADGQRTYGPQVLIGWHWTWDSGLNVALAAGAGRNFAADAPPADGCCSEPKVFANGYLRFGYAF